MTNFKNLRFTDPEFMSIFESFAFDEVVNEPNMTLEPSQRYIAILGAVIGSGSVDFYKEIVDEALKNNITPVVIKEIVYQAVAYLGITNVYPFLNATNDVFYAHGISLPLEGQSTTTSETRLEKGADAQVAIFGPRMKDFYKGGHINRWLAANCFGDYYTRNGLNLQDRELATFSFLAGLGNAESQLVSHAAGNMAVGNDKIFVIKVVSQVLPYIGYPRSLNALTAINKATDMIAQAQK